MLAALGCGNADGVKLHAEGRYGPLVVQGLDWNGVFK
jgi:hypothetical protein